MADGFFGLTALKASVRRLAQLYDFTVHLYVQQVPELQKAIKTAKPGQSIHTSTKSITHGIERLYDLARRDGPYRLRGLLLVSLVTQLEVFLTQLIRQIADRDLSPFLDSYPVEIPRARIFSVASIDTLQTELIEKEQRQLTSGGLANFEKYYRQRFGIDFKTFGPAYGAVKELHDRRHLLVHSDGVADAQYVRDYPGFGAAVGERILTDHSYMLSAFATVTDFAGKVALVATKNYPSHQPRSRSAVGKIPLSAAANSLTIVTLDVVGNPRPQPSDLLAWAIPPAGKFPGGALGDYAVRVVCQNRTATVVFSASDATLRGILRALRTTTRFAVRSVAAL